MFAIVTENLKGRRLKFKKHKEVCVIQIGKKVSKARLQKLLRRFNNDYIFSKNVTLQGFSPFSTEEYKSDVLFALFYRFVLHEKVGGLVGVYDASGRYSEYIPELLTVSKEVVLCSNADTKILLSECKRISGAIPRVVRSATELMGCEVVFCCGGLFGFKGRLFGAGGQTINVQKEALQQFEQVLSLGVDALDLAAALSFDFKEFEAREFAKHIWLEDEI